MEGKRQHDFCSVLDIDFVYHTQLNPVEQQLVEKLLALEQADLVEVVVLPIQELQEAACKMLVAEQCAVASLRILVFALLSLDARTVDYLEELQWKTTPGMLEGTAS